MLAATITIMSRSIGAVVLMVVVTACAVSHTKDAVVPERRPTFATSDAASPRARFGSDLHQVLGRYGTGPHKIAITVEEGAVVARYVDGTWRQYPTTLSTVNGQVRLQVYSVSSWVTVPTSTSITTPTRTAGCSRATLKPPTGSRPESGSVEFQVQHEKERGSMKIALLVAFVLFAVAPIASAQPTTPPSHSPATPDPAAPPTTLPPELRQAVGKYSGMGWTGYFRLWEEDGEIKFAAYSGGRDLNLSYTLSVSNGRPHLEFRGRIGTVMVNWELDYYHEHERGAWIGNTRGVGGIFSNARYYRVP